MSKIDDERYVKALGTLRWRQVLRVPLFSRGGRVKTLTRRLTELGYLDGITDEYRAAVMIAVRKFQAAYGLSMDGRVGPETWKALAHAR